MPHAAVSGHQAPNGYRGDGFQILEIDAKTLIKKVLYNVKTFSPLPFSTCRLRLSQGASLQPHERGRAGERSLTLTCEIYFLIKHLVSCCAIPAAVGDGPQTALV